MRKILHVTHTDLDGVGCAYVTSLVAEKVNADITYRFCNYGKEIEAFANELDDLLPLYDQIWLSDITPNNKEQLAYFVEKTKTDELVIFDHHPTALITEKNIYIDYKACATKIMANVFGISNPVIDLIDAYDRHLFKSPLYPESQNLNRGMYIAGGGMPPNYEKCLDYLLNGVKIVGDSIVIPAQIMETIAENKKKSEEEAAAIEKIPLKANGVFIGMPSFVPDVVNIILQDADWICVYSGKTKQWSLRASDDFQDTHQGFSFKTIIEANWPNFGGGHPFAAGINIVQYLGMLEEPDEKVVVEAMLPELKKLETAVLTERDRVEALDASEDISKNVL
jgi:hypothetical protein